MADATAHDELLDPAGRLRGPWRRMLGTLLGLGTAELRARRAAMDRAFADLGASGRVAARALPWRCDPIPILLGEEEFEALTSGLAERASLIERVLQDAYGARDAVRAGILPPGLLYPSPRYLRPCRDAGLPFLHLYAADLIRAPGGGWQVIADRTAHPGGLGYAMENRRAMAQVLPELFRNTDVVELRPFFEAWTDILKTLAPDRGPGLALLSPGGRDPRFFEHVVMARALGLSVVEDGDLTVHGGALWLKTLRGLQPVHVLLRYMDGAEIDPLELRAESPGARGTPGLLHAMRQGGVHVLNTPGSGYAQSPGLRAHLPALARHFLGRELTTPQQQTLWLGDAAALAAVQAEAAGFAFRHALHGTQAQEQAALANPAQHVAERRGLPSAAPCSGPGDVLEPQGFVLRLFLLRDGDGWRPFPGGLARVLPSGGVPEPELAQEVLSKDVWVLREEGGIIGRSAWHAAAPLEIRRMAGNLPSRIADDFYWLGRYLERIDGCARLMRALLTRLARGSILPHELPEIAALAKCLTDQHMLEAEGIGYGSTAMLSASVRTALTEDSAGLAGTMASVQDLAVRLRDRLSGEMYAALAQGLRALKGQRLPLRRGPPAHGLLTGYCDRVAEFCATIAGYTAENMVRGGSRLFLDLGRRIERAQSIAAMLRHALDQPPARIEAGLAVALELCDSAITYRGRYLNVVQPAPVFDLVLADDANPRGLAFQLHQAREALMALEDGTPSGLAAALDPLLGETGALVQTLLQAEDQAEAAAALRPRLHGIEHALADISDAVTARYFTPLRMHALEDWGMAP